MGLNKENPFLLAEYRILLRIKLPHKRQKTNRILCFTPDHFPCFTHSLAKRQNRYSPLTSAITGTGNPCRSRQSFENSSNTSWCIWRPFSAVSSFKLWPAEKILSSAEPNTRTRHLAKSVVSTADWRARIMSRPSGFLCFRLIMVIRRTMGSSVI